MDDSALYKRWWMIHVYCATPQIRMEAMDKARATCHIRVSRG
jgi:hypothetical protein